MTATATATTLVTFSFKNGTEVDRALMVLRALGHTGTWSRQSTSFGMTLNIVVPQEAKDQACRVVLAACPTVIGWSINAAASTHTADEDCRVCAGTCIAS